MSNRTEWADFFNGHAPEYDDNCFTRNTPAEIKFLLTELNVPAGGSVLDIGCGTGRHTVALAQLGYHVTGLDISAEMLTKAQARADAAGVNVDLREGDATEFSLPPKFDAAICLCEGAFGLLGTQNDPIEQPLAILRNMGAALKPGAPCLLTVLNGMAMIRQYGPGDVDSGKFDPLSLTERSGVSPYSDGRPTPLRERGFVPTELVLLFRLAGLKVRHVWRGTAGGWERATPKLDEIELMVVAEKPA